MKSQEKMNYYYGKEAEQFSFYTVPRMLFVDERYRGLSSDAKLLYGLLLSRMSLSVKNGWIDDENRVYVYFTAKEVMDELNVAKQKCSKIFSELDDENGCGLIIRKKQGLGKPDKLYVMDFMSGSSEGDFQEYCEETNAHENFENGDVSVEGEEIEIQEVRNSNHKRFENQTSRGSEIKPQEVRKSNSKYIDFNYIDNKYIDYNPISSHQNTDISNQGTVIDEIEKRNEYRDLVSDNIEYNFIAKIYGQSYADEILEIMLDAVCSSKEYLWISEEQIPQEVVKNRLLKLNYNHIEYVLDCMQKTTTKIRNIKNYLLTHCIIHLRQWGITMQPKSITIYTEKAERGIR